MAALSGEQQRATKYITGDSNLYIRSPSRATYTRRKRQLAIYKYRIEDT